MHGIEPLLLALMVAVAGLSILARLVRVPYPILLVLGGLQLQPILSALGGTAVAVLVGQAALVSAVVIAVRLGWVFTTPI